MEPVESWRGPAAARERSPRPVNLAPRANPPKYALSPGRIKALVHVCLTHWPARRVLSGVSRPCPPPVDSGALCGLSHAGEAAYGGCPEIYSREDH